MAIGEKIKKLRLAAGLNQKQVAVKADIDQGGLSKLERGLTTNTTLETLQSIARALGCSVVDLLDEEHKQKPKKTAA
ncbi:MAG: helix-turn-helix domain-containing protein [Burkholderiales bacterium]